MSASTFINNNFRQRTKNNLQFKSLNKPEVLFFEYFKKRGIEKYYSVQNSATER